MNRWPFKHSLLNFYMFILCIFLIVSNFVLFLKNTENFLFVKISVTVQDVICFGESFRHWWEKWPLNIYSVYVAYELRSVWNFYLNGIGTKRMEYCSPSLSLHWLAFILLYQIDRYFYEIELTNDKCIYIYNCFIFGVHCIFY